MANPNLINFLVTMAAQVQDQSQKLSANDRLEAVHAAIAEHSRMNPLIKRRAVLGNGTPNIGTPTGFVEQFSTIAQIEFPVGDVPPTYLGPSEWMLVSSPTALTTYQLQFLSATPATGVAVNIHWTSPHIVDDGGGTIPEVHFRPVASLAASFACLALAGYYAQQGEPMISIDSQNPGSKSRDYMALAKVFRSQYNRFFGIDETISNSVPAGGVFAPIEKNYQWGGDLMAHPRLWRRRR